MNLHPPVHGGNLEAAQRRWPMAPQPWLDLSAALNPTPWPLPEIPARCFQSLPDPHYSNLQQAAARYYQQSSLWPTSGSQQVIECLPQLRPRSVVAVPTIGYAEHEWCWRKAGHQVVHYQDDQIESHLDHCDVLVVINPNNPTAALVSSETLLRWHQTLQTRGGWLVIDEAFIDAYPLAEQQRLSMASIAQQEGLIVLKSVGKFFGLAGIRSGFVLAAPELINLIKSYLGPWQVSGVSAYLTEQLLQDTQWHEDSRLKLAQHSSALVQMLIPFGQVIGQTPLFVTLAHPKAQQMQQSLAKQGIWVRLFEHLGWLRFGLPATTEQCRRLIQALITFKTDWMD